MRCTLFLGVALAYVLLHFSDATPGRGFKYSQEEEIFIIQELESRVTSYSHETWEAIAQAHENKVREKAKGFRKKRSARALQIYFGRILRDKWIELPDSLQHLYWEKMNVDYTEEEDTLINSVLRSNHIQSLYSDRLWLDVKQNHDEKRESGCTGFKNERSLFSLVWHFRHFMVPRGRVDEDVIRKFSKYFHTEPDFTLINREEGIPNTDNAIEEEQSTSNTDYAEFRDVYIDFFERERQNASETRDVMFIDFFEKERENASEQDEDPADYMDDGDDDNELTKLAL